MRRVDLSAALMLVINALLFGYLLLLLGGCGGAAAPEDEGPELGWCCEGICGLWASEAVVWAGPVGQILPTVSGGTLAGSVRQSTRDPAHRSRAFGQADRASVQRTERSVASPLHPLKVQNVNVSR